MQPGNFSGTEFGEFNICGIVGVVSKSYNGFTLKEKDIFDELLYIDVLRGEDSTGIMGIDTDGNLDMAKEASVAGYFQAADEYKGMMRDMVRNGAALIGHNRKATKGNITDENAHPFVVDDRIVLLHNGTLYGDHKKLADVEVDSHAIAHVIHEKGDDVEAALQELHGAYALVWYDVQGRSLNFVRNAQRPLCFVETSSAWYWASEPGMLLWILARNQITPLVGSKVELLPEGELHTFTRKGRQWERTTRKVELTKKGTQTFTDDELYGAYCGHIGRARPHHQDACAYSGDAVIRKTTDWVTTPQGRIPATTNVLQLPNTPVNSRPADSARMKTGEAEAALAMKGGFVMEVARFQEVASSYSAGNWITGEVFDYDYVRGDSGSSGLFVYARMADHPDALIRCYLPVEHAKGSLQDWEMTIIGLCATGPKMSFCLSYKNWHRLGDGGKSGLDGYCVMYCTAMAPITIIENTGAINA